MARAPSPKRQSTRTPEDQTEGLSPDQKIIQEGKDRFKLATQWESTFRRLYFLDVKFANGDSDNGYQWPTELKNQRELSERPCLTINKTQMHVLMIVNEGRKNKPAIKIRPVGEDVSFKAATIWEGLCRHIEYASGAQAIYDDASQSQVEGGIGYWRVITDYVDDESFDQDVFIAPVQDHMGVYIDSAIKKKDGSDAKWGFIFENINRKEFQRLYPDVELPDARSTGLNDDDDWVSTEDVRLAEYYRLISDGDELIFLETEDGESATFYRSEVPEQFKDMLEKAEASKSDKVRMRKVRRQQLEWYKIGGNEILDRRKLKGKYIPIVRCVGRERKIEGRLERKGLVRTIKDSQRMFNYHASGAVEVTALQTRSPYLAPAAAIEGNQQAWFDANKKNAAVLTWRHKDEDGGDIPKPERIQPPTPSQAFTEGMTASSVQMEMASGQYHMQQPNQQMERTPRAINERSRIGDTANYDFVDNLGLAIAYTGKIILDLVPHYYDTERVKKIMGEDGAIQDVTIDPMAPEAFKEEKQSDETIKIVLNPKKGKWLVQADIGPAFATQRQEAWNALIQIVTADPTLMSEIGDIVFRQGDFKTADELAERIRRKIKQTAPWLLDDAAIGPLVQQLQAQVQQLTGDLGEAMQKLAEKQLRLKGKEELRDIDVFKAQTERMHKEGNTIKDFAGIPGLEQIMIPLIRQTLAQMMGFNLQDVVEANKPALDAQEGNADSTPGARPQ